MYDHHSIVINRAGQIAHVPSNSHSNAVDALGEGKTVISDENVRRSIRELAARIRKGETL